MTRVPPDRPEDRRGTSPLDEWERDRADRRRLDPARHRKAKPPPPEMTTEELIAHRDRVPPPEEGPVR